MGEKGSRWGRGSLAHHFVITTGRFGLECCEVPSDDGGCLGDEQDRREKVPLREAQYEDSNFRGCTSIVLLMIRTLVQLRNCTLVLPEVYSVQGLP